VAGLCLQKTMTSIKVSSWSSTTTMVRWSLMWRSTMVLSARRSTKLKCTFSRYSFYVISCSGYPFACSV
jgi:hypothetical protein